MKQVPRISTRGYYDLLTGRKLKNNLYYLYPPKYFAKLATPEIVIMIHGLRNNKQSAVAKFIIAKKGKLPKLLRIKNNFNLKIVFYNRNNPI